MNGLDRIFTFIFEDQHWLRKTFAVFLCVLFFWLVIPLFILQGYLIEISRRALAEPESKGLPAWDRLGEKFISGVKLFVVDMVYCVIPIMILCLVVFSSLWPEIQQLKEDYREDVITSVRSTAVPAMFQDDFTPDFEEKFFGDNIDRHTIKKLLGAFAGVYVVMIAYSVLLMLLMPIVYARFAVRSSVMEALNLFVAVRFFFRNWKNVFLVVAVQIGLGMLAMLGLVALVIGVLFTAVFAKFASYYLYGILYRESVKEEGV